MEEDEIMGTYTPGIKHKPIEGWRSYCEGMQEKIARLEAENAELRRELEHCREMYKRDA